MATANTHPELERARNCILCRAAFVERTNMGRFMCRIHPDKRLTRAGRFTCCNYPLHDMQFALELHDGAVFTGCLPCDHTEALTADHIPPVASVIPLVYVARGMVDAPPPTNIVARITQEVFREMLTQNVPRTLTVSVPSPLAPLTLDIVDTGFRILLNFVSSDYWYMKDTPELYEIRKRIEAAMRANLVADDWNPMRDTADTTLHREASENVRDVLTDEAQDAHFSHPTPSTFDFLATRVAFVRLARKRGDTRVLLRCFVPFMIVRRVAIQKWDITLASVAAYNDRMDVVRENEWHPVQRHEL